MLSREDLLNIEDVIFFKKYYGNMYRVWKDSYYMVQALAPVILAAPYLYCRPPGFTGMPQGKYLAGGLQSGCTANSIGAQYKYLFIGENKSF